MMFSITMFFPIISELGGQTKQFISSCEVEADTETEAILKALELPIIECGDGVFARPANASIYFVNVKQPEPKGGNNES